MNNRSGICSLNLHLKEIQTDKQISDRDKITRYFSEETQPETENIS